MPGNTEQRGGQRRTSGPQHGGGRTNATGRWRQSWAVRPEPLRPTRRSSRSDGGPRADALSRAGTGPGRLTSRRILALEDLPFWYWTKSREQLWHETYRQLLGFVTTHGRFPHDQRKNRTEDHLARWADTARAVRRGQARGSLTRDRIALLERIPGWFWGDFDADIADNVRQAGNAQRLDARNPPAQQARQMRWNEKFSLYCSVAQDLGRTPILGRGRRNLLRGTAEGQAASWAARQREIRRGTRHGSLSGAQIQLLDAAPFWYWSGPGRRR